MADDLLRHPDIDVKVTGAYYLSEITRITAADGQYDNSWMKDVIQLIASSTTTITTCLSGKSSRSYNNRVLILETLAEVRSDIECDGSIIIQ